MTPEDVTDLINTMEAITEDVDFPYEGATFAESVLDTARKIESTVLERGIVTRNQWEALCNMKDGVEKWVR